MVKAALSEPLELSLSLLHPTSAKTGMASQAVLRNMSLLLFELSREASLTLVAAP